MSRPLGVNDILKKEHWTNQDRYYSLLPDNVQNFLCQLKEQEQYVKIAQAMTEAMEELDTSEETPKNDQEDRLSKIRERLKRKLAAKKSNVNE